MCSAFKERGAKLSPNHQKDLCGRLLTSAEDLVQWWKEFGDCGDIVGVRIGLA